MQIDKNGGIEYLDHESLKRAEAADLVTLPQHLQNGINCSNCVFYREMNAHVGHCTQKKVQLPVTSSQCCSYYDNPAEIKSWENKNV